MKRLLILLIAASMVGTVAAQTLPHTEAFPRTQAAVACAPDCSPGLYLPTGFESGSHLRASAPAARRWMFPLVLACAVLSQASLMILVFRARRYSRSRASREAQMLRELAIQAAVLVKPARRGAQPTARVRPELKDARTQHSSVPPAAQVAAGTADCYWAYQARQLEKSGYRESTLPSGATHALVLP